MEGAVGTRSRLLLVLALVAGLLVGGSALARASPVRAPAAAPAASPALPVAHATGSTGPQRTVSRSAGAERAAALPTGPTSCGGAAGDGPLLASAHLPDRRSERVGRAPRRPGPRPAVPTSTQQDRAPPGPAGPQVR